MFRFVVLGTWTVDLKEQIQYLTKEPENEEMQRIISKGKSHKRPRPASDDPRFGDKNNSIKRREIND